MNSSGAEGWKRHRKEKDKYAIRLSR